MLSIMRLVYGQTVGACTRALIFFILIASRITFVNSYICSMCLLRVSDSCCKKGGMPCWLNMAGPKNYFQWFCYDVLVLLLSESLSSMVGRTMLNL